MKSERITFLASPDFKTYLAHEAANDGISVGELIRKRCLHDAADQESELAALAAELKSSIAEALNSLDQGLLAAAEAMAHINRETARRGAGAARRKVA